MTLIGDDDSWDMYSEPEKHATELSDDAKPFKDATLRHGSGASVNVIEEANLVGSALAEGSSEMASQAKADDEEIVNSSDDGDDWFAEYVSSLEDFLQVILLRFRAIEKQHKLIQKLPMALAVAAIFFLHRNQRQMVRTHSNLWEAVSQTRLDMALSESQGTSRISQKLIYMEARLSEQQKQLFGLMHQMDGEV